MTLKDKEATDAHRSTRMCMGITSAVLQADGHHRVPLRSSGTKHSSVLNRVHPWLLCYSSVASSPGRKLPRGIRYDRHSSLADRGLDDAALSLGRRGVGSGWPSLVRPRLRSAAADVRYLVALGSLLLLSVAPAVIAVVVMQNVAPVAAQRTAGAVDLREAEATSLEEIGRARRWTACPMPADHPPSLHCCQVA